MKELMTRPAGCGAGLRAKHFPAILSEWPKIDWFEAISENYMDTAGRPLAVLEKVRSHYPVALHGVSLSVGSADEIDRTYLDRLKALIRRIDPFIVSDHLCWTHIDGEYLHDLMPLPMTEEALAHVVRRVEQVQAHLGRKILLENVSSYVSYRHSAVPEWEFLNETARRSGCGILLDINNIYVNSVNHGFDPERYLDGIDAARVGQFHLAGYTDKGAFLFDTHSSEVAQAVWDLYRKALSRFGKVSTLIEWDEAIPDLERLMREVEKAKVFYRAAPERPLLRPTRPSPAFGASSGPGLADTQRRMRRMVREAFEAPGSLLDPQAGLPGEERMAVYADGYLARVHEALSEVYEASHHLIGKEAFIEAAERYAARFPSRHYNLNSVGERFAEFLDSDPLSRKLPFAADLARLEWAIARIFHSPLEDRFDPADLVSSGELDWDAVRIRFQPASVIIRSKWPILDLWQARKRPLSELDITVEDSPQNVWVYREGLEVRCRSISDQEAEFAESLRKGRSIGECCEELAEAGDEPPLDEWFGRWNQMGVIAHVG